ncbi:MAG TPA: glycerol-3-phosphate dehydrogenase [Steroidobacteraceae bacterium]|nr:glycerol-3-phosphate dehydrogenase [Steroidobacteraceae bacterium]
MNLEFDLLVVGGGINGAGIARDAAGRGLRVVLCEQHDLAAHTSSASTKLIHGGLRYLEYYDFALVRKSLAEREILLSAAPHIVRPLRFVLPHDRHLRPAWLIRAGLFLYDHLARRHVLPDSAAVDLRQHPAGAPLDRRYRRGFLYSDAWVDDARLVVLTALDAHERGAAILTGTRCTKIAREGEHWRATLDRTPGASMELCARAVVNAAGPWVAEFLDRASPAAARHHPRMIKGSHLVVPRVYAGDYAYLFQAPDGRVVFAIPFEEAFTVIGTTERDYTGDLATPSIDEAEVDYLLAMANRYFAANLRRSDVVWTFSGLRPLLAKSTDDPKSVTRDYRLDLDPQGPPLLSVYGGKITTYRRLAEDVVNLLGPRLGNGRPAWTRGEPLPGGDIPGGDFAEFLHQVAREYPWLAEGLRARYARSYGSRIRRLLEGCRGGQSLGEEVLPGLFAAEVDYLRRTEWARSAEDILWRRTKLGLRLPPDATGRLEAWLAAHPLPRNLEAA